MTKSAYEIAKMRLQWYTHGWCMEEQHWPKFFSYVVQDPHPSSKEKKRSSFREGDRQLWATALAS